MPPLGGQPLSGGPPPPGGEGPPSDAAEAYPSSQRRLVTLGICAMLFLMVFRNAGSSDYREEAREYLRAHGREHAIDYVVPKTSSEVQMEKLSTLDQVAQLRVAMRAAQADIEQLRGNVTLLAQETREHRRGPHHHAHEPALDGGFPPRKPKLRA